MVKTTGFWVLGIFLSLTSSASAGIIAGDFSKPSDLSPYVTFSQQDNFSYAGGLLLYGSTVPGNICSGTLIRPQWVVTSGHCVYEKPGNTLKSGKFILENGLLEANIVGGVTHKTWKALVDSGTSDLDSPLSALNDIALLKLDRNATLFGATLPKLSKTELGALDKFQGSFVGVGNKGDGNKGVVQRANPTLTLGGKNRVNILSNGTLSYDLDQPNSNPVTNIDFLPAVDLEFMPTSGDSGSPIFQGVELAGIHSRSKGGTRCLSNGSCFSHQKPKYGTLGFGTPVAKYAGWIANAIANYPQVAPRSRTTIGNKLTFIAGGYLESSWDAADIELDESDLPLEFDLVADTFSDTFDPKVFDSVFEAENPNPDTAVPEASPIWGLGLIAGLGLLLRKNKTHVPG